MNTNQFETLNPVIEKIILNIENVIIGKRKEVILSLVALIAKGHVLLEDVPGVGKTMMVRALAKSMDATFKRIQFTPDLMPSDVTGVSIYNPKEMEFEYRPGPIMGQIVLADEINRTSPKTQSALLEGLEEGSITVDGTTFALPQPFFVMATQNPIEYEGTYSLPEAQLDRFLIKMKMGYPTRAEEIEMLDMVANNHPIEKLKAVMTTEEVIELQHRAQAVFVDEAVKAYMIDIVRKTRNHALVDLGVSPRGSIALMRAVKAYALLVGRDYVIPDDVKFLAPYVLSHRILVNPEARFNGVTATRLVTEILSQVRVPIK